MICYLCGNGSNKTIFEYTKLDRYESAVMDAQSDYFRKWLKCSNCGFVYSTSNFIGQLEKIYSGKYRSKEFRGEDPEEAFNKIMNLPKDNSENHYRVQYVKSSYKELTKMFFNHGTDMAKRKVLDIGFGFCVFLGAFIDDGWEGYGIDPDPNTCKFASEKLNINTWNGAYKKGVFTTKFDLITIIHVLEHMKDPIGFLREVKDDLQEDGLLYIEIPDAVEFDLFDKDHDEFNSCHYYMFDPSTITRILDKSGFAILSIKRIVTQRGYRRMMVMAIKGKK